MADLIKQAFGFDVKLIEGGRGEFTVWLNGDCVAKKIGDEFPEDQNVIDAIHQKVT